MKLLVISDTHSITDEFYDVIAYYQSTVDAIVHCGDSELDTNDTIWTMIDSVVKGNMDFGMPYPTEDVLTIDNMRFFVTHGHLCGVNAGLNGLSALAVDNRCQIAFYGHTHVLTVQKNNGVICINPGSFNHSRGPVNERTYAIVTLETNAVTVTFYRHDKQKLHELTQTITL